MMTGEMPRFTSFVGASAAPSQALVPLRREIPPPMVGSPGSSAEAAQTLTVLRDFSSILTHSLDAEAMLRQFLLFLRKIVSINRAAIFLRQPYAAFDGVAAPEESRRLRAACAIGLSAGLLEHFELSFEAGIGGQLFHLGRILRRNGEEARNDPEEIGRASCRERV